MNDRRRDKRTPVKVWAINNANNEFAVWFSTDPPGGDDFRFAYSTKDLSYYGVFLESTSPLSVGTILDLELNIPTGKGVRVKGKVVRVVDPEEALATGETPGMGVEFQPATELEREVIKEFVDYFRKK